MLSFYKKPLLPLINFLGRKKEKYKFSRESVIVGGCGRSGTTLLLAVLSAHPSLYAFPVEIAQFTEWTKDGNGNEIPLRMDRMYRHLLTHKIPKQAERWVEKTPKNVLWFDKILNYFNNKVKIIHLIRDGRDVLTSRHPEDPNKYWVTFGRYIRDLNAGMKFMDHPKVLTVRYEDLIQNYKETITGICVFIGEEATDEILNWFDYASVRKNEAWFNKLERLHKKSIVKWNKPENAERLKNILNNEEIVRILKKLKYL